MKKTRRAGKALLLILLVLLCAGGLSADLFRSLSLDAVVLSRRDPGSSAVIAPETSWKASFTAPSGFDRVRFYVNEGDPEALRVKLVLRDTDTVCLDRQVLPGETAPDPASGITAVLLRAESAAGFPEGKYRVILKNTSPDTPVTVEAQEDPETHNRLGLELAVHTELPRILAPALLGLLAAYMIAVFLLTREKPCKAETFFLLSVLPLGIAALLLFQPWNTPDAGTHFKAMYRFSNFFLGQTGSGGWLIRADDAAYFSRVWGNSNPSVKSLLDTFTAPFRVQDAALVPFPNPDPRMEYYSVLCYLPGALGFALARLLGLGTAPMLFTGRLFLFLAFVLACRRAVRIAPAGKSVFAAAALLPMSLMLGTAVSYDGMALLASLAFTAAVLRLYREPGNRAAVAEAAAWAFLLGAVKGGGYLLLLPLAWAVKGSSRRQSLRAAGIVTAAGVSALLLFDVILPQGALFQLGTEGSGTLTAAWGLAHPLDYLQRWIRTFLDQADPLLLDTGGMHLAWLEQAVPAVVIAGLLLAAGAASVFEPDSLRLEKRHRGWLLAVLLLVFLLTPLMLLSWTPESSLRIEGLQGRYFLPALPLALLLLTKSRLRKAAGAAKEEDAAAVLLRCQRLFAVLSVLAVYFMMRLYLTR